MKRSIEFIAPAGLLSTTILAGAFLTLPNTNADDVVDTTTITVPVSCTMSGTGMNSHTAEIPNGTVQENIGTTTIKIFCNDDEGYSVYAVGFGNETLGNNVLSDSTLDSSFNIATGTTFTNTSQWAMKIGATTGTYTPIIAGSSADSQAETGDTDFSTWAEVPDTYTRVAYRTSGTDVDNESIASPEGSTITTTYKGYISPTQPAGTYTGAVKYVMVHPNNASAPSAGDRVNVVYDGNGETFQSGASSNYVVYASEPMYVANTPQIAKSSNVATDGTKESAYTSGESVLTPIVASGASKMKVVLDYGISSNATLAVVEGNWDGSSNPENYEVFYGQDTTGTATYVFDSDAVTLYMQANGEPTTDYDYGFYAQVYPIYATEQTDTTASTDYATVSVDSGTYATTTNWYGSWYANINNEYYDFMNENEVIDFLGENIASLNGQTVTFMRGLTFNEAYTRASKAQDGGYYIQQDLNETMCHTIAITQNQTLKDSRDGTTYMAGKLKDGKCWMLDNMALDLTNPTTLANVTEQNTHASTTSLNYLKGIATGTTSDQYATSAVSEWSTNPTYGNSVSYSDPLIATSGDCSSYAIQNGWCANDPESGKWTKDSLPPDQSGEHTYYGVGSGRIGIYYNYCAVSAGSYCYGDGNSTPGNPFGDATEDICPANWRMPTGYTGTAEQLKLVNKYGATTPASSADSLQYNLSTPLSGGFWYGEADYQGYYGDFWSSSFDLGYGMVGLGVGSDEAGVDYDGRYDGRSLRCVVGG